MIKDPKPVKVPKKITMKNAFRGRESDILNAYNKLFFHPSERQLDDQCFNLDGFLSGVILPRIIFYRDNHPGMPCGLTSKEYNEILDKIILSFWLDVNVDNVYRTEEQEKQVQEGRNLFVEWYDSLWF